MEGDRYRKFDISWELPVLASSPLFQGGPGSGGVTGVARANFSTWCRRFVRLNIAHRSVLHRHIHLPLEVFSALPSSHAPEKWTGSTSAEDSMQVAQHGFESGEMVKAVLQELGLAPPPARRDSLAASAASMGYPEWPSSAETCGPESTDGCASQASPGTDNAPKPGRAGGSKRPASPGLDDMTATEAELQQLRRYFPAVDKDAVFCVGCASYGHRVRFCPLQTCRICGGSLGEHGLFGCPALSPTDVVFRKIAPIKATGTQKGKSKRDRGGRGKGKDKGQQPEQSTEPADEPAETETDVRPAQKCKLCLEVTAHRDVCPMLWTTFVPGPSSLKRKAGRISASCYVCGGEGHFGGDCSKNTGAHLSGRPFSRPDDIWCQKYAMQFVGSAAPGSKATSTAAKASAASATASNAANGPSRDPAAAQPALHVKHAKRAKTSADQSAIQGRPKPEQAPAQGQGKTAGQPGPTNNATLSRAQIKKANKRKQREDAARGAQAKQAAEAAQTHSTLQTALPTRTGPQPKTGPSPGQGTAQAPNLPQKPAPAAQKQAQNLPQKPAAAAPASKKKKAKKGANGAAPVPAAGASKQTQPAQQKGKQKPKPNPNPNPNVKGKGKTNETETARKGRQMNNPGQGPPPEGKGSQGRRRRSRPRGPGNPGQAGSQQTRQ